MRAGRNGRFHLTYCTKIHQARNWEELFARIREYLPALKMRLSPDRPFGVGLRLSAPESMELLDAGRLEGFKRFLDEQGLYVFTMNGFPYGAVSGGPVKSAIFSPDWRDERRVQYTLRLIEILSRLLPAGADGSISTLPLSYKAWLIPRGGAGDWEKIVQNLLRVTERLVRLRRERGCTIHLDIEPEPDGLVENNAEFVEFYCRWLLRYGAAVLAEKLGADVSEGRREIGRHIRLCLDACHLAVSYEDPETVLALLSREGIGIGKVQIASGLQALLPAGKEERAALACCLSPFADSSYLHQVIGRREDGPPDRFSDLCQALPHLEASRDREWRIHYHMPLFTGSYRLIQSTQKETEKILRLLRAEGFTEHLEIETYTWEQLPEELKIDLFASLVKEYQWVLERL